MTIHPADERPMDTTHPLATSRTHAFHAERHARLELERLLGVVEAFCDPGVRPTFRQLVEAAFRARHAVNDANRATWEVIADGLAAEAAYRARCDAAATRDAWDVVADGIAAAAEATDPTATVNNPLTLATEQGWLSALDDDATPEGQL